MLWAPGAFDEAARGSFPEDSDSEAVERAMIAAAAWFSQRQETEE
jgi:hypothetical protein